VGTESKGVGRKISGCVGGATEKRSKIAPLSLFQGEGSNGKKTENNKKG